MEFVETLNYPVSVYFPDGTKFEAMTPGSCQYLADIGLKFIDETNAFFNKSAIVNRSSGLVDGDNMNKYEPISIRLCLYNTEDALIEQVTRIVHAWAQKSRVQGTRGERVAIVSKVKTYMNETGIVLEYKILIGTGVWYSERRVTCDYPSTLEQWELAIENLIEHLTPNEYNLNALPVNTLIEKVSIDSHTHGNLFFADVLGCVTDNEELSVQEKELLKDTCFRLIEQVVACQRLGNKTEVVNSLAQVIETTQSFLNSVDFDG